LPFDKITGWSGIPIATHARPDHHELVGLRIRHRFKDCVDDAEHRGRHADAKCKRQYGSDGEALVFAQGAKPETQVL
jgi:hypothetical protein